jgi:predicted AAA+ superfamily ATPase
MLEHLLRNKYRYVTFDDFHVTEYFHVDPAGFMNEYSNRIVFDEVQNVPEIFRHIKYAVDRDRKNYGKFVLTGSSQFAFLKGVSESLAGRIGLLKLLPLEFQEVPSRKRKRSIALGSYPELVTKNFIRSGNWYSSYLDTYLTRDIRTLREIGDMRDFRRCITLLAARAGQILNMSDLSRDIGVTVATIKKMDLGIGSFVHCFFASSILQKSGKKDH